jgi:hypothetical protein
VADGNSRSRTAAAASANAPADVFTLHIGVVGEHLIHRAMGRELAHDSADRDAPAHDAGQAAHRPGILSDSLERERHDG